MKILMVMVMACLAILGSVDAGAHEGEAEGRAMTYYGLLRQMDQQLQQAAQESNADKRQAILESHRKSLMQVMALLREAEQKSPCVLMDGTRQSQTLDCLADTESRLRMTDALLQNLIQRETLTGR